MATSRRRSVDDLKARVSRLVGEVLESDLHVVHLVVTGDPEEICYVLPARHGRYRYFKGKQNDEIAAIMAANGYEEDGPRRWKLTLTPEQVKERDKDCPVLTPAELVSNEDRPPIVDDEPFEVQLPPEPAPDPRDPPQPAKERIFFAGETPEQAKAPREGLGAWMARTLREAEQDDDSDDGYMRPR